MSVISNLVKQILAMSVVIGLIKWSWRLKWWWHKGLTLSGDINKKLTLLDCINKRPTLLGCINKRPTLSGGKNKKTNLIRRHLQRLTLSNNIYKDRPYQAT